MKKLVLALFATAVFCSLYAKVYEWPQLPDAALPDTEVVTNVALRVNVERLDVFCLKLEIDGAEKIELDKFNYIYRVEGVDYLAGVRSALGKM